MPWEAIINSTFLLDLVILIGKVDLHRDKETENEKQRAISFTDSLAN